MSHKVDRLFIEMLNPVENDNELGEEWHRYFYSFKSAYKTTRYVYDESKILVDLLTINYGGRLRQRTVMAHLVMRVKWHIN